jgi:hypothetical protein
VVVSTDDSKLEEEILLGSKEGVNKKLVEIMQNLIDRYSTVLACANTHSCNGSNGWFQRDTLFQSHCSHHNRRSSPSRHSLQAEVLVYIPATQSVIGESCR